MIGELTAREGMTVMAGAPLFRINGLSTVWVNAEVPEVAAAQVRPGNPVEARTPAVSGAVFKGKVSAILPEVNPATRTIKARIELANPGGQLVPGMFATVSFAPAARKDVLLVPSEAVIQTGKRSVVVVAQGDGKFAPVDVEIGLDSHGQTEIRKGLQAGQKVVVSGQFLVDSEANLKAATTRMGDDAWGQAMIAKLIRWSIANRFLVLLATLMVDRLGRLVAAARTPLDAIPDLSDVQVIIRTTYPGPGAADRREPGHLSARRRRCSRCRARRPCAATRSSAIRSSTSCSRTAPICTGRARACSNT